MSGEPDLGRISRILAAKLLCARCFAPGQIAMVWLPPDVEEAITIVAFCVACWEHPGDLEALFEEGDERQAA
jgi:hypothetical protein